MVNMNRTQGNIRLPLTPLHQTVQKYRRIQPATERHQKLALVGWQLGKQWQGHGINRNRNHARHVTGHSRDWQGLLLIEFQRQVVRVFKKGKTLAGVRVHTDSFAGNIVCLQMSDRVIDIRNAERQMT